MVDRWTPEGEVGGFDPHSCRRVVSLSKIHSPPKSTVNTDMTEKLFTGTLSKKRNENLTWLICPFATY